MAKAALIVFSLLILHSCAVQFNNDWSNNNDDSTEDTVNEFKSVKPSWLVAILRIDGREKEYVCGGSLIGRYTVITSARCAKNLQPYRAIVRSGAWDIPNAKENVSYVDRDVSQIIVHPEFRIKSLYNNLGVLKVVGDVHLTVGIIFLPRLFEGYDYSDCYAIGWGSYKYEEGAMLKKIDLPLVEHKTCQNYLRKTRLGSYFQLHESFLCAGGEAGVDTCSSDSGMPLICKENSFYGYEKLMGIVSWGIGCGQENVPGVYANVSQFFFWINSINE